MLRKNTIQIIERAIKNCKGFYSRDQLWQSLPRNVQYTTFLKVLENLAESNKITYEKDGIIIWTFADSAAAKKSLKESTPL